MALTDEEDEEEEQEQEGTSSEDESLEAVEDAGELQAAVPGPRRPRSNRR